MKLLLRSVFLCLILCVISPRSFATTDVRTVALTGKSAPGSIGGFGGLVRPPSINGAGEAAFFGSADEVGLWAETGGSGLRSIAQAGMPAPGIGGNVEFSDFDTSFLHLSNNAGFIAFKATVSGDGIDLGNDEGLWLSTPSGGLELLVREGQPLPDDPNQSFTGGFGMFLYSMNEQGQAAFFASHPNGNGIYSASSGTIEALARRGQTVPFLPTGETYADIPAIQGALNQQGQTAFETILFDPNSGRPTAAVVVADAAGSGRVVARRGEAAPGDPNSPELQFFGFFEPVLNSQGETAFIAASSRGLGVWTEGGGGGLRSVAKDGDSVPGGDPGDLIRIPSPGTLKQVVLNDRGETAFIGNIQGTFSGRAVFKEDHTGQLEVVARTGSSAPGTTGEFADFDRDVALNLGGQTAFYARLFGTGIDGSNDEGIWAEDANGLLQLIAREGDLLDVSDNPSLPDLRTIASLGFLPRDFGSANAAGGPSSFSDLGRVVFQAWFTDGSSGVFVSNVVGIPEPSTLALFVLALPTSLAFRRR